MTDIEECRKEFEAWVQAFPAPSPLGRGEAGNYLCRDIWFSWEAWRAARSSDGAISRVAPSLCAPLQSDVTRPTALSVVRAWQEYCRDHEGEIVIITDAQFHVTQMARQFDAESPAGTEPVIGPYCKYCGKETHHIGDVCFFCSKAQKAEKVTTSPERVQIPSESKHVQCPKCPAHMPVGLHCGGPNCPLRK